MVCCCSFAAHLIPEINKFHPSEAQEEDGDVGRRGESPAMRKYHAGFGRERASCPIFWAWWRTLTSGQGEEGAGPHLRGFSAALTRVAIADNFPPRPSFFGRFWSTLAPPVLPRATSPSGRRAPLLPSCACRIGLSAQPGWPRARRQTWKRARRPSSSAGISVRAAGRP